MMKAGKYWVGDLCYVIRDDEWMEVCNGMDTEENNEILLKRGVRVALVGTAWGDGSYYDKSGQEYGVDSGTIGCVLLEDIQDDPKNYLVGGHVVDFPEDFSVVRVDGVISIGHIEIDTDPEEEFDDEDEDEDEDDEYHVYGPEYYDDENDDFHFSDYRRYSE